jgi:long-chain fatty acid transport protein
MQAGATRLALANLAATVSIGLAPLPASAGGLWLWEVGSAADVGTATASWGAGADDASTAWTNPAAMTLLERSEIGVQLSPSLARYRFDADAETTTSGGSGSNTTFVPILGSSAVWAVNESLRVGGALGGISGGSLDYGDDWAGRYLVTEVTLNVLAFTPGVAWRAKEWLSVGGSLVVGYGALDQRARVNNLLPGQDDGRVRIQDAELGVGGVFGLLLEPVGGTRIALTYRTPLDLDLDDRVDFDGVLPPLSTAVDGLGLRRAKVEADMTVPQQILIGFSQRITDELTLVANADWEDWSEFLAIDLALASTEAQQVSAELESRDTWHGAVGLRWRPRPRWLLTTGVAYDSSMFSDSNRSPLLPVDRQIRVGAGVQHDLSQSLFVGFSYEYMNGGEARLQAGGGPLTGTLSGDYDRNEFHFFTVSLNWRP